MRAFDVIAVVVGAGIGGGLRYAVGYVMIARLGDAFPWQTLLINVLGAFLLGVLMALSTHGGPVSMPMRLFLGVGVLGGFTTFSAFSYEIVALLERGRLDLGALYLIGSAVLGVGAAALGLLAGRAV
jgi:CrcB protein